MFTMSTAPHRRSASPLPRGKGPGGGLLSLATVSFSLALHAGTPISLAQVDAPNSTPLADASFPAPASITGTNFAGLRYTQAPVQGQVILGARRVHAWSEGTTRRLFLSGDVRVTLGGHQFSAARAVAFVERISPEGATPRYQVFVYFDRAGTSTDAASNTSIQVSGDRLPVRGVIECPEGVRLRADALEQGSPRKESDEVALLFDAETAFARSLRRLIPGYVEPEVPKPVVRRPNLPFPEEPPAIAEAPSAPTPREATREPTRAEPGLGRPAEPSRALEPAITMDELLQRVPVAEATQPIFAKEGLITLSAGELTLVSGTDENAVMATGGVVVQYNDLKAGRALQITGQRAVVFLNPGKVNEITRLSKEDVRGIYMEGDVSATDGRYTLRGPKMFYDLNANRAIVLDAVFWTYDEQRRLPLYVRAKSIRQESADQFKAEQAIFANSAFFEPEFCVGATSVTVSRRKIPAEERHPGDPTMQTLVDARNITLRAYDVPFFYWPIYSGDPSQLPLRDLRVENSSSNGAAIKARWNAYSLLGLTRPTDLRADLQTDYYFNRGLGLGAGLGWDRPASRGEITGYMLPSDTGKDVFKTGFKKDRDGDFRGIVAGENRWKFSDSWTLFTEGTYISDEGVVDAFFRKLGEERREFTNRVYARRLEDNTATTIEAKTTFNDFISNEYLLQSRGYSVSKLPEVAYVRQADDLAPGIRPGYMTYFSEYRVGRLSMNFDEVQGIDHGLGQVNSRRVLGTNFNETLAERLRREGYFESAITRADTRHEISVQMREGPVNIQPFILGRLTAYDNDFDNFSPRENDNTRVWGAAGVRFATTIQRVDNGVDSRFFDLHRLRHIVEPSATMMFAGTNIDRVDLPIYDYDVESLAEGNLYRFGVAQTWQTQRGGPGRWHSVDVFKLNTDVVVASGDADPRSPIGRFYDYRPEYSNPGNYLVVDGLWRISDVTALTGGTVFDFDLNQPATSDVGVMFQHSPRWRSYVDSHFVNALDRTIIAFGSSYQLTSKYDVGFGAAYDASANGFQGFNVDFQRKMENITFGFNIGYNDISGETSFGFTLRPYGAKGGFGVSGVGSQSQSSGLGG